MRDIYTFDCVAWEVTIMLESSKIPNNIALGRVAPSQTWIYVKLFIGWHEMHYFFKEISGFRPFFWIRYYYTSMHRITSNLLFYGIFLIVIRISSQKIWYIYGLLFNIHWIVYCKGHNGIFYLTDCYTY